MAFATASVLPAILANPASYEPQSHLQQQPQQQALWTMPRGSGAESDAEPAASDAGDYTTDDEPTIRAAHSSASSETQSIYTVTSEDTDADHDLDDDDEDDASRHGLFTQGQ